MDRGFRLKAVLQTAELIERGKFKIVLLDHQAAGKFFDLAVPMRAAIDAAFRCPHFDSSQTAIDILSYKLLKCHR